MKFRENNDFTHENIIKSLVDLTKKLFIFPNVVTIRIAEITENLSHIFLTKISWIQRIF